MSDPILFDAREDGIAIITINRPEQRNALSKEVREGLWKAWERFESDDGLRIAILTGAGEKSFCAGGDLKEMVETGMTVPPSDFIPAPYDNLQQIRVLPAGGNIRAMGSVDAQLRVWKVLATALFVDAGMITNDWSTVTEDDIRPSAGIALVRIVTPFGIGALERAIPLRPQLGDDPRGRWHLSFAARAQF